MKPHSEASVGGSRVVLALFVLISVALVSSACDRGSMEPEQVPNLEAALESQESPDLGVLPRRPLPMEHIPSRAVALPPIPRPEDSDPAALVRAVREQEGSVLVGLKPSGARKMLETGRSPAIGRQEILVAHTALEAQGLRIEQTYATIPVVAGTISPNQVEKLLSLPFVDYVEPAIPATLQSVMVGQDTAWGVNRIRARPAWEEENTGHAATMTFLDTGVDSDHLTSGDGPARLTRCLVASPYQSCYDDNSHGSHVSGIAAGRDNSDGYIGIAPYEGAYQTPNVSIKVCGSDGACALSAILAGLDWTTTRADTFPRQVVNMSWGKTYSQSLAQAISGSYQAGNLLVAAAGNNISNSVKYPARFSEVIAVSGTTAQDGFAGSGSNPEFCGGYSTYGDSVEISAPYWATSMVLDGEYDTYCGTSMAAPVVTGVAALVWTKNQSWTNAQVRAQLQNTAKDLGTSGRDPYFGYGRVDAGAAVGIPEPAVSISGPTSIPSNGNYTWTASATGGVGSYSYKWYRWTDYSWPRGQSTCHYETEPELVGTGSSYSDYVVKREYDFRLMVSVTSGVETFNDQVFVLGDGSMECPFGEVPNSVPLGLPK